MTGDEKMVIEGVDEVVGPDKLKHDGVNDTQSNVSGKSTTWHTYLLCAR